MVRFNTVIIFKLPVHDTYLEDSGCAKAALSRPFGSIKFREEETDGKMCCHLLYRLVLNEGSEVNYGSQIWLLN